MINIVLGNDYKKKSAYLKKACKESEPIFIREADFVKEKLFDYAESVSLFNESPIVVLENLVQDVFDHLSKEELTVLKDSTTTFFFFEEKLLASDIKKYNKYAQIEDFGLPPTKQVPKINVFDIADAFSRKDKVATWVAYINAVSLGASPEEISGVIFWKIKTMILNGTKFFSTEELKSQSSKIVSIYHLAHRGEVDFTIGLEQFILSSLGK